MSKQTRICVNNILTFRRALLVTVLVIGLLPLQAALSQSDEPEEAVSSDETVAIDAIESDAEKRLQLRGECMKRDIKWKK